MGKSELEKKLERKYRGFGSPQEYYANHPELHNLSRWQLGKKDLGLYGALKLRGELEKLIPEKISQKGISKISLEKREIIDSAYVKYSGSISLASKMTNIAEKTIKKYWNLKGYEINPSRTRKIPREKRELMDSAYGNYKGNITLASKMTKISKETLSKHWHEKGYETKPRKIISENKIEEILNGHQIYEGNANKAAKEIQVSSRTIVKYWKNAGLNIRSRGRLRK